MTIETSVDIENNLTIFFARETLKAEDFGKAIQIFYENRSTKKVLWDLTRASIWDLSGDDVEKLALYAPRFEKRRKGSKTAIVASDDFLNAMTRLFILFGESKQLPIDVKVFETQQEAMSWITD